MELESVLDSIDRSGLTSDQQAGFVEWLTERPHMQVSIQNALSKGQPIKALKISKTVRSKPEYTLRIGT